MSVAGRAKAAARETTPRMPVHATTNTWRARGAVSFWRKRRVRISQETLAPGKTHASRSRIRRKLKIAPLHNSVVRRYSWIEARMEGSWSPIRTKTKPFRTKFNDSHTDHAWMRTEGEKKSTLRRARNNPHVTTASTPEAWALSAAR